MTEYRAPQLKILALHFLRAKYPGALLIPEFAAAKWGDAMIDVAAVTPKKIIGVEIKGDGDSLARIDRQGWVYARVASTMYLLTSPLLFKSALKKRPPGWGMLEVNDGEARVYIQRTLSLPNAPASLVDMLWKPELVRVAGKVGVACRATDKVHTIVRLVSERAPLEHIRKAVMDELMRRDWSRVSLKGKKVYWPDDELPDRS